tara:strand:- start:92 stop:367 length:276 start_codon:yes stop_codon:yes gene_type:complete
MKNMKLLMENWRKRLNETNESHDKKDLTIALIMALSPDDDKEDVEEYYPYLKMEFEMKDGLIDKMYDAIDSARLDAQEAYERDQEYDDYDD